MASLEEQSSGNTEMNNLDAPLQFYVCSLMPPVEVNTVAAGSRTRRMSDIPGRRRSLDAGTTVETLETSEQEVGVCLAPALFCVCLSFCVKLKKMREERDKGCCSLVIPGRCCSQDAG